MDTNLPMRYYILRGSSDPSVLGNTTGIKQADIKRNGFLNPEEFDRVIKDLGTNHYWEVRDLVPHSKYDVQYVEMMPKSKVTEFLRFGPFLYNCPFMISEKVIQILAQHLTSGGDYLSFQGKAGKS